MRSSKAPHEGFECCLGPRLLNPVEDWVGNWADPLNTRGLKKLAELTRARRGDTLIFFVLLWECKRAFFSSLVPRRGRGEGFRSGGDYRERGKDSAPHPFPPVSSSSLPAYRPSIAASLQSNGSGNLHGLKSADGSSLTLSSNVEQARPPDREMSRLVLPGPVVLIRTARACRKRCVHRARAL